MRTGKKISDRLLINSNKGPFQHMHIGHLALAVIFGFIDNWYSVCDVVNIMSTNFTFPEHLSCSPLWAESTWEALG